MATECPIHVPVPNLDRVYFILLFLTRSIASDSTSGGEIAIE